MAGVKPFKGYRYQIENPQDLTEVIAPPYDMIDREMIDALYQKDPAMQCGLSRTAGTTGHLQ